MSAPVTEGITEEALLRLAALSGIAIAPEHRPGVIRSLDVLLGQAAVLAEAPVAQIVEPAPVFRA